jgi:hypothetical protein
MGIYRLSYYSHVNFLGGAFYMKDLRKLSGVIFVAAIIACAMAGCELFPNPNPTPTSPTGSTMPTGSTAPTNPTTPTNPVTQTFTSVAAFRTWLNAQPDNNLNTAYSVVLNISSLDGLKEVLHNAPQKYVRLDLSGSTLTAIPDNAFQIIDIPSNTITNCPSLVAITIPNSVTSIGKAPFGDCTSLTAINVASGNNAYTSENGVLYNKNKTTLIQYPAGKTGGTFTIPNSVTNIGDYAFSSCPSLTSITIPANVTSIGYCAFAGCTSLTSVKFEGTITSSNIYNEAFGHSDSPGAYIGDLRAKYLSTGGGIGTYTKPSGGTTWTKQAGGGVAPGSTYIITGSGTSFTAANSGATIGSGAIQDVIKAIRTHAAGKNLTIQFGNGTVTLDIGTATAEFNNTGGTWGLVTLTGKITSATSTSNSGPQIGTIIVRKSVSVTSNADIANTDDHACIAFDGGTLSIIGGNVFSARGYAILNWGTVIISGGMVSTIGLNGATVFSQGTLTISGGMVSAQFCDAVFLASSTATATISGSTVSAVSDKAVVGLYRSKITVSGTAKLTSANLSPSTL